MTEGDDDGVDDDGPGARDCKRSAEAWASRIKEEKEITVKFKFDLDWGKGPMNRESNRRCSPSLLLPCRSSSRTSCRARSLALLSCPEHGLLLC